MNQVFMKALKILVSLAVIIAACLELLDIAPGAIKVAMPLVGLLLLLQGVEHINNRRWLAILSFCCALFIFVISTVAIFF